MTGMSFACDRRKPLDDIRTLVAQAPEFFSKQWCSAWIDEAHFWAGNTRARPLGRVRAGRESKGYSTEWKNTTFADAHQAFLLRYLTVWECHWDSRPGVKTPDDSCQLLALRNQNLSARGQFASQDHLPGPTGLGVDPH